MNVPPASTKWSRIANEVLSAVTDPKSMAPSARTLTSRRVAGSVPMVRYFMTFPSGSGHRHPAAAELSVRVEAHFSARALNRISRDGR